MANIFYVGEIGTEIIVDCGSVITGATETSLKVKKPDGTTASWAASIDGTNHLTYTIEAGDFDQVGTYYIQASLTLSGWTGFGEIDKFTIEEPITTP